MNYLRLVGIVFTAALVFTCIHWAATQKAHFVNLARFRLHYFTFAPLLLVVPVAWGVAEWRDRRRGQDRRAEGWQFSLRGLFIALVFSAIWIGLFLTTSLR